jgi:hypothetical protein
VVTLGRMYVHVDLQREVEETEGSAPAGGGNVDCRGAGVCVGEVIELGGKEQGAQDPCRVEVAHRGSTSQDQVDMQTGVGAQAERES